MKYALIADLLQLLYLTLQEELSGVQPAVAETLQWLVSLLAVV